jgi:tetratricopeptide (TPR) repeat protein
MTVPAAAPVTESGQLLQTALHYHRAGRLLDAETLYRQILAREPAHAEATHLLGMIAHQSGQHAQAVELITRAIGSKGQATPYMHNNLAQVLSALQRTDEAIQHYRQAIALDARYVDAINNLGVALTRSGRLDEAEAMLKRAIALEPKAQNPRTNLGNLYQEMNRYDDAIAAYRAALAINPDDAAIHNNLGNALKDTGHLDSAIDCYQRAIELAPQYAQAINNLAVALQLQGRLPEALETFRAALELEPHNPNTISNRAYANLAVGNFAEGWRGSEARFDRDANRPARRTLSQPAWSGESLQGKTLRVWGEQGVGDEIWASGMYAELPGKTAGGGRVIVECRPKLASLFGRSFPEIDVVALTEPPARKCLENVDFQIACGSLGQHLRPNPASFPKRTATDGAYLFADPAREGYWRKRIAGLGPGLKIGISWRSQDVTGERALACARLTQWAAVLKIPGVHFINLQYDECEAELAEAEAAFGVRIQCYPEVDMYNDLDETAALMRGMDLVISAPTTVSIMAAALGVRTWQTHYGNYWQGHGMEHNPWYPAMRVYHRKWNESWEQIFGQMAVALENIVAGEVGMAVN